MIIKKIHLSRVQGNMISGDIVENNKFLNLMTIGFSIIKKILFFFFARVRKPNFIERSYELKTMKYDTLSNK